MQLKLDALGVHNATLQRLIDANDPYRTNALQVQLDALSIEYNAALKSRVAANTRSAMSLEAERERSHLRARTDLRILKDREDRWKKRESGWSSRETRWEQREELWNAHNQAAMENFRDLQREHHRAQAYYEAKIAALEDTIRALNEDLREMAERA